ncbi:hypothetical protein [Streptomyces misionensis]|uniref:hypothetical protein n=1 Tax=Streptomyces misionensis TaxID=67331 RepID=UPI0036A15AB5
MLVKELRRLLNTVPITADNDPVMFMDRENVEMYSLKELKHEGASYDEGGNVTSVGGTLWLNGESA